MSEGPVEWWTRLEFHLGDDSWNAVDIGGPTEDGAVAAYEAWTNHTPDIVRNIRLLRREFTVVKSA